MVAAGMAAAALGALERRARRGFGDDEQRAQVDRRMPTGIVLAAPGDADRASACLELLELRQRGLEPGLVANDPGVALHHRLQRRLARERVFAVTIDRHE